MIRGLYTAAAGMMVEAARQEIITHNLANSETHGFKKDLAVQLTQTAVPLVRAGGPTGGSRQVLGTLDWGVLVAGIHTSGEQGSLQETGRALDLALSGEGFFAVETPRGVRYTRNGAFTVDAERFLVTENGDRVLGTGGFIRLPEGETVIDEAGRIYTGGILTGQLQLTVFSEPAVLQKDRDALFAAPEDAETVPFDGQVRQGYLESSNVSVADEMVRMLVALRAYETNQRVIQVQNEMLGKAVNEVGALR
ncbi:MAG TPA: flagellar hook-basal body protein [Firmicutes bacterium]|nr:flagellar hook-basal body protein [Bacillota bacterium]